MRDTRPRHLQIAAGLRDLIMSGVLRPGQQLPSTGQLKEQFETSGGTIQRALQLLKAEGFIQGHFGAGVFVRDRSPIIISAQAYIPAGTGMTHYDLLSVDTVHPPADIAECLRLEPGATTVRRRRVLVRDQEPVELSASYYPNWIAEGTALAGAGKIRGGAPRVLAELGYPLLAFDDRVSARQPTTEELQALCLPGDVPVLRQLRVHFSTGAAPVTADVLIKGAHRFELRYHQDQP